VEIEYLPGEKNIVADALSRIPKEEIFVFDTEQDFPLDLVIITNKQTTDSQLQKALKEQPAKYTHIVMEGTSLNVHSTDRLIYIPESLCTAVIQWYHIMLQHPGIKRMQATIKEHFYWPGLDGVIERYVKMCVICQKCKITAIKKYGKSPLRTSENVSLWEEVHVDLIGPWKV
jgi:hypothetical protein